MKQYIKDEMSGLEYIPLEPGDTASFDCCCCGQCCRKIESSVPLESLDVFRIAKHLRKPIEDVIEEYTEVEMLIHNFPMLFLKTRGEANECIFLKNNRCTIHDSKPRTCRMYPFSAGPGGDGGLEYIWAAKEHHMYMPGKLHVRDWMEAALSPEDREFLQLEYDYAKAIGFLLGRLPKEIDSDILREMLVYRYFAYDMSSNFIPQYKENMSMLINVLVRRIERL